MSALLTSREKCLKNTSPLQNGFIFRAVPIPGLSRQAQWRTKKGVPLSFDPGRAASRLGAEKLSTILERVELLLLNKKELMALTGSSSHLEVKNISREFNCSVVLKTGHGPAIVCHDGHAIFEVPPFNAPEVVDTLGAGDAFGSGVICGKMEGKALYEAVRMGHACAAAKVMHAGAQAMPKKETIRKLFKF